jgi:pimeloyl-ACP methyl ester carboxylesterase
MKRLVILGLVTAAAIALVGLGYRAEDRWQRREVFRPDRTLNQTPASHGITFSDIVIASAAARDVPADVVHGWWLPAADARAPAVLYLHGQAGDISSNLDKIVQLHDAGLAVLAIDYRGFGASAPALPDERSAYADADAGWAKLLQLSPQARKHLIYGHSLGGAIAVDLASHAPRADGLIVEGSFSTLLDEANTTSFKVLPLSLIATQTFDSDAKARRETLPKLFIHCTGDHKVPFPLGEKLYQAAAQPKTQLIIPGGNHYYCSTIGAAAWRPAVRRFAGL